MDFHHILVPVDMSEHARAALGAAADLARATGARLHLLHAHGLSEAEFRYLRYMSEGIEREVAQTSRRELEQWAERFAPDGVETELHTSALEPREAILAAADEVGADLIAMGTHGRSGLKRMLMGSVTEFVVRSAPCPVLTVRASGG